HGRAQLNEFLARQDIALNVAGEIERLDAVKTMVMQLPVAGFLPAWVVGAEIKQRALVALPAGHKPFEQTWGLIHSAARPLNHAESTFLKFCRQQVSELI
ncbi:MAG: LysR family transcriptional regulator substrate-binding protein, partial [Verrucomicrobia bacterium]|nr:LysR family transcriptional regulator substrate-binding protein [Verrucomicrobiota bacterium]